MNNRIKELVKQAEEYAFDKLNKLQGPVEMSISRRVFEQSFREKFAELIVRECAQVCRDQPNHYALKADRDNCAIAIEEHFGVEE